MTEPITPDPSEETKLSRDATHSTYEPDPDVPTDVVPPPGPSVIETRNEPTPAEGSLDPQNADEAKRMREKQAEQLRDVDEQRRGSSGKR